MHVISDNKSITEELNAIIKLLVEKGSWFHENINIICKNGNLSLQACGPINPDENIIKVPQKLFIPIKPLNITLQNGKFTTAPDKDKLSPDQIELGTRMINLFNLADKANAYKTECPVLLYKENSKLLETLFEGRSTMAQSAEKLKFLRNETGVQPENEFICWDFLETRALFCDYLDKQLVLMPVIDCLNHEHNGCPFFTENEDNSVMVIKSRQPYPASNECFAFYGLYDALDTFLHYGFPAEQTPLVRSIPIDNIPIGSYGTLTIKSLTGRSYKGELNKGAEGLKVYMPSLSKKENDEGLEISHLFIPVKSAPHSMRRILQIVLNTMVENKEPIEFIANHVYQIEKEVLRQNIAFYNAVIKKTKKAQTPQHLKDNIISVATIQLNKLHKYLYKDDFFKT